MTIRGVAQRLLGSWKSLNNELCPVIIDNRNAKLVDHLNGILETAQAAKMAVGEGGRRTGGWVYYFS